MFGLIRRISYSVIPRPDRPWADDATSNAPTKGKKRRLSSTEREQDHEEEESKKKKIRSESLASEVPSEAQGTPQPEAETFGVKEVTKGVKAVELSESEPTVVPVIAPESVPLPEEEDTGELEKPGTEASPPLDAQADPASDDIASSVDGVTSDVAAADAVTVPSDPTANEEEPAPVVEEEKGTDEASVPTTVEKTKKTAAPEPNP
ncbi:hypothetical protein H0H87_002379 [Tephrocybe sp. NHM501043]|nr:hypothetical protein H0H87_002379 [Tephrocybe sp. NHM501043]